MLSGFLSSGNLCLIHYFKLFWPHTASTAFDRKGAKMQHEFSWFFKKNFPKYQKKVISVPGFLNSRTWMPLKTSVVIFQALKALAVSLILAASATSLATKASTTLFPQITSWYWWSDHCHQNDQYWTFVCGMDYQKPNFSLINGTLSDGGCWGQPMLFFQNLVN